jgi:hypothetical protein
VLRLSLWPGHHAIRRYEFSGFNLVPLPLIKLFLRVRVACGMVFFLRLSAVCLTKRSGYLFQPLHATVSFLIGRFCLLSLLRRLFRYATFDVLLTRFGPTNLDSMCFLLLIPFR